MAVEAAQQEKEDAVAFQKAICLIHTDVKLVLHHARCPREEIHIKGPALSGSNTHLKNMDILSTELPYTFSLFVSHAVKRGCEFPRLQVRFVRLSHETKQQKPQEEPANCSC